MVILHVYDTYGVFLDFFNNKPIIFIKCNRVLPCLPKL